MTNLFLFLLDLILGAIAYMMFISIFTPFIKKNALYEKLKAKERQEIDRKLDVEQYFGAKLTGEDINIPVKLKKQL